MAQPDTLCVVGLWHLGPVAAACWADLGHPVVGVDESARVVEGLRAGRAPVFEPGLDSLIQAGLSTRALRFTRDLGEGVSAADVVLVAFDTPVDASDQLDLAPVESTVLRLAPFLRKQAVLVVSSQVPVGTCARWRNAVRDIAGRAVGLAYVPENLRLGDAIRSYRHPERVVLGADDETARQTAAELFGSLGAPIVPMSLVSAEMAKHALNSFLATSVSFINEIATLCEVVGADVLAVAEALRTDPRVGPRAFLSPGLGFAGGTLGRDLQVLRATGRTGGVGTPVLDAVLEVNRRRGDVVLRRLARLYSTLDGLAVGVLGLTYKAGTSTLRRSVALEVIRSLVAAGAKVKAFDPKADLAEVDGTLEFEPVPDAYEAARGASALLVLTEWPEFVGLDFGRVKALMASPVVFDGKNLLADLRLGERGFTYMGVGR